MNKVEMKKVSGSILNPNYSGLKFVLAVANTEGKPTSKQFVSFDKKWRKVKEDVKNWWVTKTGAYKFGAVRQTAVQSDVWVTSMLCQKVDDKGNVTTDQKGLEECLKQIAKDAKYENASVHVAKELLDEVESLESKLSILSNAGIKVFLYSDSE